METAVITQTKEIIENTHKESLSELVSESFKKIAPFWPLKNLIAVNPLQGFEGMSIEEAFAAAQAYFQQSDLPEKMEVINRETIKWLQAYFDSGQATLSMPRRKEGLYAAWRQLAVYDTHLHANDKEKIAWLRSLSHNPNQAIAECLLRLSIPKEKREQFLILLLTSLPGWAAYIKYRTEWTGQDIYKINPVTQADYLAMRIVITSMLWPTAKELIVWHQQAEMKSHSKLNKFNEIQTAENNYRLPLLEKLAAQPLQVPHAPEAQFVFCIDVRSEPFRRALEATGDYQTLGFAGFFGVPVTITDSITRESYASCPVLLSPKHEVTEMPSCSHAEYLRDKTSYKRLTGFKRLYQSVKYTFTTPFVLVDALGMISGAWMLLRSFTPRLASKLKTAVMQVIRNPREVQPVLDNITFNEQCSYAEAALKIMGLTHHFAPVVVFCGHGSRTQNNPYATALDCGACGGRHGASNARILAAILNQAEVRKHLATKGLVIPDSTRFIAAEHNTTTDEVVLYGDVSQENLQKLKLDLQKARTANSEIRLQQMGKVSSNNLKAEDETCLRSHDWAQVRPEWGLARNAAFIVGPRAITRALDLEGRCFLHSYDYTKDIDGASLTVILTAPMVVAEWINTQYLFSTLDNIAYGSGSKTTQNITGKIGVMQGNASDLMTGLPLQSLHISDTKTYHELQRLMTVVYAPRQMLDSIIQTQPILQKLFGNGWVQLACIEPEDRQTYFLSRDLEWQKTH